MTGLPGAYAGSVLPAGVRSRFIDGVNGLRMHVLEAGFDTPGANAVFLLHGFPELAYSWRRVMPRLAAAGFHVIAPDQRGYGRTTGADTRYDTDLAPYQMHGLAGDVAALAETLGYSRASVVGHDFGSPVAAWCGLIFRETFTRVGLMSAPFAGPPRGGPRSGDSRMKLFQDLAELPRPRKHYQDFYCRRGANADLLHAPQGVHDLLRAYYHHKSADWSGNRPHPLGGPSVEAFAELPTYYVMDLDKGMAETVAEHMPDPEIIRANAWLPDDELAVYTQEFERTGFQGGLNWYRAMALGSDVQAEPAGRTLDQPTVFIAGASDWGIHQTPGAFEHMQSDACTDLRGVHLIDGAGHWVQQEQAHETSERLLEFLTE